METSKYLQINIRLILNSLSKSKSIFMFDDINSGEQSTEDLEFYKKEIFRNKFHDPELPITQNYVNGSMMKIVKL